MKKKLVTWIVFVLVMAGCAQPATETNLPPTLSATPLETLRPYLGPTFTATPSPTNAATATPLPSATPTPQTHVIKNKEDLWGIALRYGVTLEDMMTANPTTNPRFLRVGDTLKVPAPLYTATPDAQHPPLPTPVNLALSQPVCAATAAGGLWCFTSATDEQPFDVEGVSAVISILDRVSGQITTQMAYPPLNRLQAGAWLPLAAYFPAPAPDEYEVSAELHSALPISAEAGRYLDLAEGSPQVVIAADGLSAHVTGELSLAQGQSGSASVLLAGVAFAADGSLAGIRNFEPGVPLESGQTQPYEFTIYSTGAPITQVAVLSEASPLTNPPLATPTP